MVGVMAFSPSASATTRPPENPECPAIVRTIEHYLPIRNRADDYRAFVAVDDFVDPFTLPRLDRWVGEVGGAFQLYSIGVGASRPMHGGSHARQDAVPVPAPRPSFRCRCPANAHGRLRYHGLVLVVACLAAEGAPVQGPGAPLPVTQGEAMSRRGS